jgi:predicted Zn-dependent protease
MASPALKGLALLWLRASLTDALSMRESDPTLRLSEADDSIEPTNQAEHDRPEQRVAYQKHSDLDKDELEQHRQIYHKAGEVLGGSQHMSHSKHILRFIMSHPNAPVLPHGGCLYLPNDKVWSSFYQHLEHPFPSLFAEMIANSYYPGCNDTSVSGLRLPSSCGPDSMQGSRGCFNVNSIGSTAGVEVYETHGHLGLPDKWSFHIANSKPHVKRAVSTWGSKCGRTLPEVSEAHRLEIPTRYVVCRKSDTDNLITEEHVREQNRWANEAFSGKSIWKQMSFDTERPPSVDMQISFKLENISIVTDAECARRGFTNTRLLHPYNQNAQDYFTVVIITNDASGILGQTEFPHELAEDDPEHMVVVSSVGFRNHASRNGGDMMYDEGDTVVHEAGHGFGLYHTFEGSCSEYGQDDQVEDTPKESMPHYDCVRDSSCGRGNDPVHNFMDYSPDTCMVGFTEGQKRRAWCELQNHRTGLYQKSLKKN